MRQFVGNNFINECLLILNQQDRVQADFPIMQAGTPCGSTALPIVHTRFGESTMKKYARLIHFLLQSTHHDLL
jgi:hypothetical protein